MLAVGCQGGVALWSLGRLPLTAANVHRGPENGRAAAAETAQGGGWVTFLPFKHGCRWVGGSASAAHLHSGAAVICGVRCLWCGYMSRLNDAGGGAVAA